MPPRRQSPQIETHDPARDQLTSEPDAEVTPVAPDKKRTRSDGVLAGQLFERLCTLDADEAVEIAASPADIRAKFEARRAKALADVSEEVRALVNRMRGHVEAAT